MPRVPISTSRGFSGIFSLPSDETTSGNFRSMGFLRKKSTSPFMAGFFQVFFKILLGQWLNFGKLVGSTYLVGENADMQFKLLFQGPGRPSEFFVEQKKAKTEIAKYSTDPSSTHAIELAELWMYDFLAFRTAKSWYTSE